MTNSEQQPKYNSKDLNAPIFPLYEKSGVASPTIGEAQAILCIQNNQPIPEEVSKYLISIGNEQKSHIQATLKIWSQTLDLESTRPLDESTQNLFRQNITQSLLSALATRSHRDQTRTQLYIVSLKQAVLIFAEQQALDNLKNP